MLEHLKHYIKKNSIMSVFGTDAESNVWRILSRIPIRTYT